MSQPIVSAFAHTLGISTAAAQIFFVLSALLLIRALTHFTLADQWNLKTSKSYLLFMKVRALTTALVRVLVKVGDVRFSFSVPSSA